MLTAIKGVVYSCALLGLVRRQLLLKKKMLEKTKGRQQRSFRASLQKGYRVAFVMRV